MAKLSAILAAVKSDGGEKTASVAPATTTVKDPSSDALKTALHEVLASNEKKASASVPGTPVRDLEKVASQIAENEHQALLKEGQVIGAAAADGFMARLSQYNEAAEKIASQNGTKIASVPDSFEKFAAENETIVKQAAELGYTTASNQIGQLKQAAFDRGYETGVLTIYKTASECFVRGFEDCGKMLEAMRK